jgi:hypothetical protein
MHRILGGITAKMTISAEIQIDMALLAIPFIGPCRFGVKPGVVALVVGGAYGFTIRVTDLTRHRRTAGLHMAGVTYRFKGLVVDDL